MHHAINWNKHSTKKYIHIIQFHYMWNMHYVTKDRHEGGKTSVRSSIGRALQGARPCASHHGLWWAPWSARGGLCHSRSVCFFNAAFLLFWYFDLGREFCLCWVILGLLCKLLWFTWPSTSSFLLLLSLTHSNLQSKFKQTKTSVIVEIGA